jgi:hypothetical protein
MAREAVYIRIILEEMWHKQPPTPLQTDNSMAEAVINGKVQSKWTKAMDMWFHWLQDQECQQQFRIYWRPGKVNYADYWTKHHPATHHQNMRKEFIMPHIILEMLRIEQQTHAARAAWRTQVTPQNWRAQIITCKTKLPKIAKRLPSWRGELEGTINTLKWRAQKLRMKQNFRKLQKKIAGLEG